MAIRLMSAASSTLLSGRKLKISAPITMPSAIAIRMYCVNLFDIAYPRKSGHPANDQFGRFQEPRNTLRIACVFARMFPLWIGHTATSVPRNAQCMQLHVSCARPASIIVRERSDERERQSADPAGGEAVRQTRPRTFQADQWRDAGAEGRRSAVARALHLARCRQSRLDAWRDLPLGGRSQHRDGRRRHCRSRGIQNTRTCARRSRLGRHRLAGICRRRRQSISPRCRRSSR